MYHQDLADHLDRVALPLCAVLATLLGIAVPLVLAGH